MNPVLVLWTMIMNDGRQAMFEEGISFLVMLVFVFNNQVSIAQLGESQMLI